MPRPPKLTAAQRTALLATLRARFEEHAERHPGLAWSRVEARLEAHPAALPALRAMEESGGEPDVVAHDAKRGELVFFDCAAESPAGRRSCCYDRAGWESRAEHRPEHNAMDLARTMGIALLTEDDYRHLQALGEFDRKTSSWLQTPAEVRALGGAIFGDRRYGRVFIYHNGAQSYYGARGFRGSLKV